MAVDGAEVRAAVLPTSSFILRRLPPQPLWIRVSVKAFRFSFIVDEHEGAKRDGGKVSRVRFFTRLTHTTSDLDVRS